MSVDPYSQASHELLFSPSLCGKECGACRRVLPYSVFDLDSSVRDGRALICPKCKATPRLSTAENTSRLREANFSAVERERRSNEEDYLDRDPVGRAMYTPDIINKLRMSGAKIVAGDAHFANEVSLYAENSLFPNGAQYVGWLPIGLVQEFSEYEYNEYSVPTWEIVHGYRGVLKNLIALNYITEKKCQEVFGPCDEKVWAKTMWELRNKH